MKGWIDTWNHNHGYMMLSKEGGNHCNEHTIIDRLTKPNQHGNKNDYTTSQKLEEESISLNKVKKLIIYFII